jgi:hypothetical protein
MRVIAVVLVLFSAGCFVMCVEVDTLSCDRGLGTCTLRRVSAIRGGEQSIAVSDLLGAELADMPSVSARERSKPARRIVLLTTQGTIPFMGYGKGLGLGEMEEQAAAITHYVATPTMARLELRRHNLFASLAVAAMPGGMGALCWWLASLATKLAQAKPGSRRSDQPAP